MKKNVIALALALLLLLSACAAPAAPATTVTNTPGTSANPGTTGNGLYPPPTYDPNVKLTSLGDASPMPGYDAQNKYAANLPMCSVQETDGFYLGTAGTTDYMHYYDKATGISDYLCADPACEHNGASCGAYTSYGGPSVFWYAGQRWWLATKESGGNQNYLYRSDLSGLNQETVKTISADIIHTYQP